MKPDPLYAERIDVVATAILQHNSLTSECTLDMMSEQTQFLLRLQAERVLKALAAYDARQN